MEKNTGKNREEGTLPNLPICIYKSNKFLAKKHTETACKVVIHHHQVTHHGLGLEEMGGLQHRKHRHAAGGAVALL